MKKITFIFVFFISSFGFSQELVNFFLEPDSFAASTEGVTLSLHTSFYHYNGAGFTGYEYSLVNNELTVSLCYNLSSTTSPTNDRKYLPITIPPIDGEYTLTVNLYTSDDVGNPCDFTHLVYSGSSNFSHPYNPTETTTIPDDNFETFMEILGYGDDIPNNDNIFTHRIENLTKLNISRDYLYSQGLNKLEDLTGIEDFVDIRILNVYDSLLTSIDISNNTEMVWFVCSYNPVETLDFSSNPNLTTLSCGNPILNSVNLSNNSLLNELKIFESNLSSIDLSNNVNLEVLNLFGSNITSLDLTNNPLLERLNYNNGQLSDINLSNNTVLEQINVRDNNLTSIDFTNNTSLTGIYINDNQITTISISELPLLISINASGNYFDSLDLSSSVGLENVMILYNSMTYLNIKNGNNENLDLLTFYNEFPLCIEIDDENEAPYSGWYYSNTTIFTETCTEPEPILDSNQISIDSVFIYPNPSSNILNIQTENQLVDSITIRNLQGIIIKEKSNSTQIDVSELATGVYFIQIFSEGNSITKKFIKQ